MGNNEAKSWRTIRGGQPLSEKRMDTYQRLMDAESRLDHRRRDRGLRETAMADALDAIEGGGDRIEPEDDLYLRTIHPVRQGPGRAHRAGRGVPRRDRDTPDRARSGSHHVTGASGA